MVKIHLFSLKGVDLTGMQIILKEGKKTFLFIVLDDLFEKHLHYLLLDKHRFKLRNHLENNISSNFETTLKESVQTSKSRVPIVKIKVIDTTKDSFS